MSDLLRAVDDDFWERHGIFGYTAPPAELAADAEWAQRRRSWEEALRRRHAAAVEAGVPWGRLTVEETSCMRGVAL